MKKFVWFAAAGVTLLGVAGGALFLLANSGQSLPAGASSRPGEGQTAHAQLNVRKKAETQADVLEMLDYETGMNQDTVGWLWVPGTDINNSVVQGHDNTAYLRSNERREYDLYGCYFADYECVIGSREQMSPNIVIYGHSDLEDNPDGPRFSQLFHFTDPEFAKNTPVIQFSNLDGFMYWEVFAVAFTGLDFDFIQPDPPGGVDAMAATAKEKSLYQYDVEVGPDDHVLVLSTCTGRYGPDDRDHRFIVMAKLLPEDAELPAQANIKQ